MLKKGMAWAALLFLFVVSSCNGGGGGGGGGAIPLDQLGTMIIAKECSFDVRCGAFPDQDTCQAALNFDDSRLVAEVNAGKLKYDGTAEADCLNMRAAQPCSNTALSSEALPQACKDAFVGQVPNGGACGDSRVCASGYCDLTNCAAVTGCCLGTCLADPSPPGSVAIGGSCPVYSSVCVDGAFCQASNSPTGATCAATIPAGQPCNLVDRPGNCAPGSFCIAPSANAHTGICGRFPAEGSPCVTANGCDSTLDFCDPSTLTCKSQIPIGGACPLGFECVGYAICDVASRTCRGLGKPGDACDPTRPCLSNLSCVSNACVPITVNVDATCI